jgi:hypothetical protein
VMARRTTRFPGATVKAIGEVAVWSRARRLRRRRSGTAMMTAEEEQCSVVPGHGSEGRVAMAWRRTGWRRRRRRGSGKFWQTDGVQVKILRLGFKDREAEGFIGRP